MEVPGILAGRSATKPALAYLQADSQGAAGLGRACAQANHDMVLLPLVQTTDMGLPALSICKKLLHPFRRRIRTSPYAITAKALRHKAFGGQISPFLHFPFCDLSLIAPQQLDSYLSV